MAKRKRLHKHSGKIIPLQTFGELDHKLGVARETNGTQAPNWSYWREKLFEARNYEVAIMGSDVSVKDGKLCFATDSTRDMFLQRTSIIAEALAGLDLLECRFSQPEKLMNRSEAEELAFHAAFVGTLIMKARIRLLEPAIIDGLDQQKRGYDLAEQNAAAAFSISRDELLDRCKKAFRRYHCNQKELCDHVAKGLPVGGERVRQLIRDHKITKVDYS